MVSLEISPVFIEQFEVLNIPFLTAHNLLFSCIFSEVVRFSAQFIITEVVTNLPTLPIKNKIRDLRFFADEMTQQELAELIGITRQTIMAIKKCKCSPTLEVVFKIAEVFGHSIDEVFQYHST
jgi:putative transcriptional regulator